MTLFWIGMGGLTFIAVAFVFWPLFQSRSARVVTKEQRTQQNVAIYKERLTELENERAAGSLTDAVFWELKIELEKNLLIDADNVRPDHGRTFIGRHQIAIVFVLAMLTASTSLGLYGHLGRVDDLVFQQALQGLQRAADAEISADEAIGQLQQALERNPDNPQGWYLLASTYMTARQFQQAAQAFENTHRLLPKDSAEIPMLIGRQAQAMFFANQGVMDETIRDVINSALEIDPNEMTSLTLLGVSAFEQQDYAAALNYWQKAKAVANPELVEAIDQNLLMVKQQLELQQQLDEHERQLDQQMGDQVIAQSQESESEEKSVLTLSFTIELAESLQKEVSGDEVLFVFARSENSPMPIAVKRIEQVDFPIVVTLTDADAMLPDRRLSSFDDLIVGARLSQAGFAQESTGDFKANLTHVKVSTLAAEHLLIIDTIVE